MDNPPNLPVDEPPDSPDSPDSIEQVPPTLPGSTRKKSRGPARVVQYEREMYSFVGPIPPPELLAEYNRAVPNAAERILCMAESQQKHRQYLEKTVVDSDAKRATIGLWLGFLLALVIVIGSMFLVAGGHSVEGLTALFAVAVTLVGSFVYAQRTRMKERLARSANESEQGGGTPDAEVASQPPALVDARSQPAVND